MGKKRTKSTVLILQHLLENTDTDVMRNTLTRLFSKLKEDVPRSTLQYKLKDLVKRGVLEEESEEIRSTNNQPMIIVRYKIAKSHVEKARKIVKDSTPAATAGSPSPASAGANGIIL